MTCQTTTTLHRLADGPLALGSAVRDRAKMVADMAALLVESGCYADARDSISTLRAAGYSLYEVLALRADARYAAAQTMVAREISQP
jgi:hypothetical protein